MTSFQGTLASQGTLYGRQSTFHEQQNILHDHWDSLYSHQGTAPNDEGTMPGHQLALFAQVTPNRHQGTRGTYRRTDEEIDTYWSAAVIQEPVSDEMKALIRADLKKVWYFSRVANFRNELKTRWETTDYYRMVLKDAVGEVEPTKLKYLCNKPTAFYWLQSAQQPGSTGQRTLMPKIILAAIYEEWVRCHKAEPNIEYGHFFANPVRITSTGPSTIQGVLEAHRALCARASHLIDQAGGRADNIIERNPSMYQHYSLSSLYHAIVVMIDCFLPMPDNQIESDGFVSLRKVAQNQTVLIARTGLEENLSAPISFESLKAQSFPLERPDAATQGLDIIRVSLASAVHFIVGLEMRENDDYLKSRDESTLDKSLGMSRAPRGYEDDSQVCNSPKTWVDAVMAAAEKHGYDDDLNTRSTIRRIEASKIGEDFCPFEHQPFRSCWRY